MLHLLFHVGVLAFNLYSFWFDQRYVEMPFPNSIKDADLYFKARHIFLTQWCFLLQTVYFAVATVNDLIGTNKPLPKESSPIRAAKDTLFILAFPIATYVSTSFWGIYAVDRELIFPTAFDPVFPSWLNHAMHTYVFAFILIELMTSFRAYPSRKCGSILVGGFMVVYIIWVNTLYFKYNIWVYPVLEVMNWIGRLLFFAFSTSMAVGWYVVSERLNSVFWGKELSMGAVNGKKKKH